MIQNRFWRYKLFWFLNFKEGTREGFFKKNRAFKKFKEMIRTKRKGKKKRKRKKKECLKNKDVNQKGSLNLSSRENKTVPRT